MPSSLHPSAKIPKLPPDITTMIVEEIVRDEIVEVQDLSSLSNLIEIAMHNKSLSVLEVGLLSDKLAERILLDKAIFRFHKYMHNDNNRLKRIPHLSDLRRIRIDINLLPVNEPLAILSNLPNLEEVTVWCNTPKHLDLLASRLPDLDNRLLRAKKGYRVILEGEFLVYNMQPDAFNITLANDPSGHVVCKVRVSEGKLLWLQTADDTRELWKEYLTYYANLDVKGVDDE